MTAPKVVFGGNAFFRGNVETVQQWMPFLHELGIDTIDSAQNYGESEAALGRANAPAQFNIHTKLSGVLMGGKLTKDVVLKSGRESLEKLNTQMVDVYYIHAPDRATPLEETLAGIQELYQGGAFRRLGLSNFLPHEVEEVVRITTARGWVRPSVYQGSYSAVARRPEAALFPLLQRHGLAFYAYSPIAGGFLAKASAGELAGPRWDASGPLGRVYHGLYAGRPGYVAALAVWGDIAAAEGVGRAELAYRWIAHHSALRGDRGDAILVGTTKPDQLREVVAWLAKGPLSREAAAKVDELWEGIKDNAPLDNFNDYIEQNPL